MEQTQVGSLEQKITYLTICLFKFCSQMRLIDLFFRDQVSDDFHVQICACLAEAELRVALKRLCKAYTVV